MTFDLQGFRTVLATRRTENATEAPEPSRTPNKVRHGARIENRRFLTRGSGSEATWQDNHETTDQDTQGTNQCSPHERHGTELEYNGVDSRSKRDRPKKM